MALAKGSIRTIGSTTYNKDMDFLLPILQFKDAIDYLNLKIAENSDAFRIGRTDSGGSPTWDFVHL